jgi:flagellar biosynthesis protein FliP
MKPYALQSYNNGIKPYMDEKIGYEQAFMRSVAPFKKSASAVLGSRPSASTRTTASPLTLR